MPANLLPDYGDPFRSIQWARPSLIAAGDWYNGSMGPKRDLYFVQSDAAGLTRLTGFIP
jgi:hypothetical protein